MGDVFTKIGFGLLFGIIVFTIVKLIYNRNDDISYNLKMLKEAEELKKKKAEIILAEQKENERKDEIRNYLELKKTIDSFNDDEAIAFFNLNMKNYHKWKSFEKEINKDKVNSCIETSKYIITSDFHSTSDTESRMLKNKNTGKILRKWWYGFD